MAEDETGTTPKEQVSGPSPSRRGEEIADKGEPGRTDEGTSGAGRPAGKADARWSTGVDAESKGPIDEEMPEMPPP